MLLLRSGKVVGLSRGCDYGGGNPWVLFDAVLL